jgi:hypothetical protein
MLFGWFAERSTWSERRMGLAALSPWRATAYL